MATFEELQKARAQRDGTDPAASGTPVIIKGLEAPKPADPPAAAVVPAPDPKDPPRNADGTFAKKDEPPAVVEPVVPADDLPPPTSVDVTIDGKVLTVDPKLAALLAEEPEDPAVKAAADRAALVRDVAAAVRAPAATSTPEIDAIVTAAIAEAEKAEKELPPEPDPQLLINDPATWQKQNKARTKAESDLAVKRDRIERVKADAANNAVMQQQATVQARETLRVQFFNAYPELEVAKDVVQPLMNAKFDEVVASGMLNTPEWRALPLADREKKKLAIFKEVAATAARAAVKLLGKVKAAPVPAAAPPVLATSTPAAKTDAPKPAEPEPPKDKYPKGSVSALLDEKKRSREKAA